jgi:hypothetical protein
MVPASNLTETRMQYLLMLFSDPAYFSSMTAAQQQDTAATYGAYTETLRKSGHLLGSNRLRPASTATTVKVANGKSKVLDGPYAESKEQLGGYYLIDVPDLDAALTWAARCPGASHGTVEVRPVWTM